MSILQIRHLWHREAQHPKGVATDPGLAHRQPGLTGRTCVGIEQKLRVNLELVAPFCSFLWSAQGLGGGVHQQGMLTHSDPAGMNCEVGTDTSRGCQGHPGPFQLGPDSKAQRRGP